VSTALWPTRWLTQVAPEPTRALRAERADAIMTHGIYLPILEGEGGR
jgi:hypothetical protein